MVHPPLSIVPFSCSGQQDAHFCWVFISQETYHALSTPPTRDHEFEFVTVDSDVETLTSSIEVFAVIEVTISSE